MIVGQREQQDVAAVAHHVVLVSSLRVPVRSDAEAREFLRAWVPEYVEAVVEEAAASAAEGKRPAVTALTWDRALRAEPTAG